MSCQVRQVTKVPEGAEAGCLAVCANFALGNWLYDVVCCTKVTSNVINQFEVAQFSDCYSTANFESETAFNIFQYLLVFFKEREANASKKEDVTLEVSACLSCESCESLGRMSSWKDLQMGRTLLIQNPTDCDVFIQAAAVDKCCKRAKRSQVCQVL